MTTRSDERGNLRALPKPPDALPRFVRRIRELAPPYLFPNDAKALEAAIDEWEKLEPAEESYLQTFLLAQIGVGLGEVLAELRTLTAEVRKNRQVLGRGFLDLAARGSFGDAEADDDDDVGDDDDDDVGNDDDGDSGEGEDEDEDEGEDPALPASAGTAAEAEVIDAEVEEVPEEPAPAKKPRRQRQPSAAPEASGSGEGAPTKPRRQRRPPGAATQPDPAPGAGA